MDTFWIITGGLGFPLGQLNALDRLRATGRRLSSGPEGILLWGMLIIALAVIVAVAVAYGRVRLKRIRTTFHRHAGRRGLSDEETNLLARIAGCSGLKDHESVFTSEAAFDRGLAKLTSGSDRTAAGFGRIGSGVCSSCTFLVSLKEKLGFQIGPEPTKPTSVKLGRIDPGTRLSVFRQRSPNSFHVTVAETKSDLSEVIVFPETDVGIHAGETWVVRYPHGGILWEFGAWVVKSQEKRVAVRPTGDVRWVNRRRFLRIRTRRPAYIACFPFHKVDQEMETPEFVSAVLTEIGGPGLKFEISQEVELGERVLVILELQGNGVLEGAGIVRYRTTDDSGAMTVAVELIGLTTSEIAALVKETNLVAYRSENAKLEPVRQGSASFEED